MSSKSNAPTIIKRKKVIAGGGHHGGAWKVAYADFVTAMMAFFLLMWLLNATTEKQRKGLADYFNPTIPINRISGGGDGAFGGDSIFTENTLSQNGTGASSVHSKKETENTADTFASELAKAQDAKSFAMVQDALTAISSENRAMQHVISRLTEEGLTIELFDLEDESLFEENSEIPAVITKQLVGMLSDVLKIVNNDIAVSGYVRSRPIVQANNPVWELSSKRANQVRLLLERNGTKPKKIQRVTGYADRKPFLENPMASRNNRIEIILLRNQPQK